MEVGKFLLLSFQFKFQFNFLWVWPVQFKFLFINWKPVLEPILTFLLCSAFFQPWNVTKRPHKTWCYLLYLSCGGQSVPWSLCQRCIEALSWVKGHQSHYCQDNGSSLGPILTKPHEKLLFRWEFLVEGRSEWDTTVPLTGKASDYQITNVTEYKFTVADSRLWYIGPTNQTNPFVWQMFVTCNPDHRLLYLSLFLFLFPLDGPLTNTYVQICVHICQHINMHRDTASVLSVPSLSCHAFHVFDCGCFELFKNDK